MIEYFNESEEFDTTTVLKAALDVAAKHQELETSFVVRVGTEYYRKEELTHSALNNPHVRYSRPDDDIFVIVEMHVPGYFRKKAEVANLVDIATFELQVRDGNERAMKIAENKAKIAELEAENAALHA